MADYVWAQTARILGADRVQGTDVPPEVEALPTRTIERYLDRGWIAPKPPAVDLEEVATQEELDDEEDARIAADATKQDASTAATDAELTSGLATKQDAATAATDSELTSGLATKQDASTAATDAELAAAIAAVGGSEHTGSWHSTTAYDAGDIVTRGGELYLAKASTTGNDPAIPAAGTVAAGLTDTGAKTLLGAVSSRRGAQPFILTANTLVRSIDLSIESGAAITILGTSIVQIAQGDATGVLDPDIIATATIPTGATGWVECFLDSEVQLKAGETYTILVDGAANGDVIASFVSIAGTAVTALSGITLGASHSLWYGNIYGSQLASHRMLFRLKTAATAAKWEKLVPASFVRGRSGAWRLKSFTDSLIIGSDRFEHDASVSSKVHRAWFDKAMGAIRAGWCTGTNWDSSNVGQASAAFNKNTRASQTAASAFGDGSIASGSAALATGTSTTASGTSSSTFGDGCTASNNYAQASGQSSQATAAHAVAGGRFAKAKRAGEFARAGGCIAGVGDAQATHMHLIGQTTNATPLVLTANAAAAVYADNAATVVHLNAQTAINFSIQVIAKRSTAGAADEVHGWTIRGVVARTNSGAVRLVGVPTVEEWYDAGASTWTCAVTADDVNKALALTATGEAAKTIQWSASVTMTEITGI